MDTLEALKTQLERTGEVTFIIPVAPVTKKNHSQIIRNRKTGKRMVIPSKQYTAYLEAVREYIPALGIDSRVNVKAVFYLKARYKADLTNLCQALHDVMVACGCVADDNCRIIASMDGTEAGWDKENPRTEVTITKKETKE